MTDEKLIAAVSVALQQEAANGRAAYHDMADAAIAAAEPIIRAQVIEELAQKAGGRRVHYHGFYKDINEDEGELADWLRAHLDEPDDRKIYIGFKGKQKDKDKARD
jgi:hypothetical protein